MTSIFFGDMAAATRNMRMTTQVKQNLDQYTYEVASGQKYDLAAAVSGDFSPLASIERSLRTLESYDLSIREAGLFATSMQSALETVSGHVEEASTDLVVAADRGDATSLSVAATDAHTRFDSVVATLNTRIGDRSLFSGAATGKTSLMSSDEMITELQTALVAAGASSVADVEAVVDDWFMSAGGGFETVGYRGSDTPLSAFSLGDQDSVQVKLTGDDDVLRKTLKGLAMASLVDEGLFSDDVTARAQVLHNSGEALMGARAGVADLQSQVGSIESRIEEAKVGNSTMTFSYETAKSEIVAADPYEAASLLQQTETQLQLIYTLTARMSQLSLADYIR
ncbi:flagellin [Celeribacter neptunius]|uniref:Flagellar hook-associated protein 3 FlgL n=1 Tax=Celeribacter neptunius TaxID=588602 RepID=A0A1I3SS11_9RHOB|nr:flagellin [Celeribacter neptunius]SFJ61012.1 flagellar hook-associated protein 3 FlgL [Celeribacter neptunius]